MKKLLFVAVLVLAACGNKTGRTVNDTDSLTTDSLIDVMSEKHTAAYISQRVDSMYSRYKNATRNQFGLVIDHTVNYDSMFCSTRYQNLKSQALALTEDDLLLDYDHWTNSQDDGDFSYQIEKIENITDSTAVAYLNAENFGNDYEIVLSLFFERGDWYVDDFLSPVDGKGEKAYFQTYIHERSGAFGDEEKN